MTTALFTSSNSLVIGYLIRRYTRRTQLMDWNELVSALASVPALSGAVCRSRAPLFDATHDALETSEKRTERISVAQALCGGCPALVECRDWAHQQLGKLSGVVAGELYEPENTIGRLDTHQAANAVVDFVQGRSRTVVTDVAQALDITRGTAAMALSRAARAGLIHRVEIGVYSGKPVVEHAIGVSA
ncbi:hypothetical protein R3P95_09955 [Rhodococcus cercidiphylli]|uniref:4Fe-4S Wbl-type domain-containing protein n=2 Tax=Rhodococcus cercidiphylli TaxID=489916 RepID=A0ABU4AX99_9NOCA|nr:hypothetical protein [Rhodococcus cercidiphylli]